MIWPMSPTEWEILDELERDVLVWGAAVAVTWKNLVAHGYVEKDFGDITKKGRKIALDRRRIVLLLAKLRGGSMAAANFDDTKGVTATMTEAADEIAKAHTAYGEV